MMKNDWKSRLGVVYSTNADFDYENEKSEEPETLSPKEQKLTVSLDKKNRKGKSVTLVTGFIGKQEDLKELGKFLKSKCGVGGSVKDGELLIQGAFRTKIMDLLRKKHYMVKRSGG
jgi:translation initiation factor 1